MKNQFATWGSRVDVLGQADKVNVTGLELIEGVDEVFERATQTVELPDDQRITWPRKREGFRQPLALELGASALVEEELLTAGLFERIDLEGFVLLMFGNAYIADFHFRPAVCLMRS